MKYILVFFLLFYSLRLLSLSADSISVMTKVDTVKIDSISYLSNNIRYNAKDTLLILWDKAKLFYHDSSLNADTIQIDFNKKQAYTRGISVLKEGKQSLKGIDIKFDLDKKKGLIKHGESKFDKGFYYGEEIRKIDKNVYDVDDGIFTTCDANTPHFYIKGKKVRVYLKDKVVMKPVVFFVNNFPIIALPFATFSLKRGRKTGILTPSPGYNKTDGKYLRNIAFYYAYKNYADFLFSADLNEKTGWGLHFDTNYIKRYNFNGSTKIYLKKRIFSPVHSQLDWHIIAKHHHNLKNRKTFDLNLDFISSKNILEGIDNVTDRLNKKITSKMSYKFPLFHKILFIYGSYTHDILKNVRNITLPSVSYSLPSKPLSELFNYTPLNPFSFSYSFKGTHYGKITEKNPTISQIFFLSKRDSNDVYVSQHNAGILNSFTLRFSKNFIGWLNFSSSVYDKFAVFDRDKNNKKLPVGNSYGFNSGLKFSLYGIKKTPNFFISAIRHIITPSLGFSYHPDFTKNSNLYSFSGIGVDSSKKSENVSFSLLNKWQLKIHKKDNPIKLNDFFSIKSSINYNFSSQNKKGFSKITHYVRLRTGELKTNFVRFNFLPDFSLYEDPYLIKINSKNLRKWKAGIIDWNMRMVFKVNISSNAFYYNYFPILQKEESNNLNIKDSVQKSKKKWYFDTSLDFNTNKNQYKDNTFTSSLRNNLKFNITKNWYFEYQNYYNLKSKKLVSYSIILTRDLHCWKFVFRYTKQANYWSYNFRIFNLKLPDTLKFKTSDNKRF